MFARTAQQYSSLSFLHPFSPASSASFLSVLPRDTSTITCRDTSWPWLSHLQRSYMKKEKTQENYRREQRETVNKANLFNESPQTWMYGERQLVIKRVRGLWRNTSVFGESDVLRWLICFGCVLHKPEGKQWTVTPGCPLVEKTILLQALVMDASSLFLSIVLIVTPSVACFRGWSVLLSTRNCNIPMLQLSLFLHYAP